MARLFTDGAEMGDTLFWSTPASVTNVTTSPRSGSRCYQLLANGGTCTRSIAPASEVYGRTAIYVSSAFNAADLHIIWRNGVAIMGSLRVNTGSSKLEAYVGSNTLVATGAGTLQANNWYSIEYHIVIGLSGTLAFKIDGITDLTYSGNTIVSSLNTIDNIGFAKNGTGGSISRYDDLALNDTTGGADNSWTGDGKIVMIRPTAAGDVTQLTPSAGENWECVDETPPNQTDNVSSATAGQYDLYNCGTITLAANEVINRIQVSARARENSATGDSIALGVKTGGTEYFGSNQPVTTVYSYYAGSDLTTNPATAAAWVQADIDALQVGVKVI